MGWWTYYLVFISFAPPILIGFWLGNRTRLEFGGIIKGAVLGMVSLVAIYYISWLLLDLYLWKSYIPEKSAAEALGENWLRDPLMKALNTLIISYVFFLMAYCMRVFSRGRTANIAKAAAEIET